MGKLDTSGAGSSNVRPLQALKFTEKIAKDFEWVKENHRYLKNSIPALNDSGSEIPYDKLWDVYNGIFPKAWFKTVVDPFSAADPANKAYAAKIRPTPLLTTNINLLVSEFAKRPFPFQVVNKSPDAYNSYVESLNKKIIDSVNQFFLNGVAQALKAQGRDPVSEGIYENPEAATPEKIVKEFPENYQDDQATAARDWLDNFILEHNVWEIWKELFLEYLVIGGSFTYKAPRHSDVDYHKIPSCDVFYPASTSHKYLEDLPYCIVRRRMHLSEIVDKFYHKLKIQDIKDLDSNVLESPASFYSHLKTLKGASALHSDMHDVYHTVWKSLKYVVIYEYIDPVTGNWESEEIDEDDPRIPELPSENLKWETRDEIWECWEIGEGLFVDMGPIDMQRNGLTGTGTKLPYNGRIYSGTANDPTSILKLGIPLQILYLIGQYKLEETIATNPGKIALIDKHTIPRKDGWNEEKFFYHARALRFGVIDRSQAGVDKSWNQYTVLDLSLFEEIAAHIDFLNYIEQRWDKLIGISPQRKSETKASETATGIETAIQMSSVMTEHIFDGFQEFLVRELQGLVDCSQLANIDGLRKLWHSPDMRTRMLEINPEKYCYASLGVHAIVSAKENAQLGRIKNHMQALIQNGLHPDTVIAIELADSVGEVKKIIKNFMETQAKIAEQNAKSEEELEARKQKLEQEKLVMEKALEIDVLNADWDRKDNNTILTAQVSTTPESPQELDVTKVEEMNETRKDKAYNKLFETYKFVQENMTQEAKNILEAKALDLKEEEIKSRERMNKENNKVALKNKVSGEK